VSYFAYFSKLKIEAMFLRNVGWLQVTAWRYITEGRTLISTAVRTLNPSRINRMKLFIHLTKDPG
jgi:hypothetical protein